MTQKEFDSEMSRINGEWMAERKTYDDELDEIISEKHSIQNEIQGMYLKIHDLCERQRKINQKKKDCNMKYHEMKHSLCVNNPKPQPKTEE